MRVFQTLKPGLFTTVQDIGRRGYLKYGVPISGAMDQFSLIVANLLVANDENAACLETTLIGPEFQALAEVQIAITGGNCTPKINNHTASMWQTLTVREGDVLSFGKMESGCRAYIAIRGGIDVPLVLGSRSTYARGGFGGNCGRQLKTGDTISVFDAKPLLNKYRLPEEQIPRFSSHFKANVVLGPQAEMFTEKGIETFLSNQYRVTLEADRMGYRLEGSTIGHRGKADIVSDALLPGAIQVPKNGKPILIMKDAQTTGGYPKIAVVVASDLSSLGQAKPDDKIEFSKTTISQAHEKSLQLQRSLDDLRKTMKNT
jgi:biotin-dependent carboxylase-like uncharacterized protein